MKLIQLNVERSKHRERVQDLLAAERPDVACLEEVMENDLEVLCDRLTMHALFAPMTRLSGYEVESEGVAMGVALLARESLVLRGEHYYVGSRETIPTYLKSEPDTRNTAIYKVLLVGEVTSEQERYLVGVTHFTWSHQGICDEAQQRTWNVLGPQIASYPALVLAGDLNIPRATNELYRELTALMRDHVPQVITSTMDPVLHRAPSTERHMVDYLLTRGAYDITDVRMVCGVSDHCALIGTVHKRA